MSIFGERISRGPDLAEVLSGYAKKDYVDAQDGLRVLKTGDTMSGDLDMGWGVGGVGGGATGVWSAQRPTAVQR